MLRAMSQTLAELLKDRSDASGLPQAATNFSEKTSYPKYCALTFAWECVIV